MTASMLPPALVLTGPTASGKSRVAIELTRYLPCEIVSVDSALVYRGMDIGTAKPDRPTRARVAHHLIDLIEPDERYSAAQFLDDALAAMQDISARGNLPLLTGGTMLYLKALASGMSDLPAADPAIRALIDAMAAESGWDVLHAELARLDPDTAARLDPNDAQRIQRALEVVYLSGEPMSKLLRERPPRPLPYRLIQAALVPSDRSVLHQRIEARFDEMLELGLIGELRGLRAVHALDPDMPSMRCVGYRQVWNYLDGRTSLAQLRDTGVAATRQLAKRQLTWLRSMPEFATFDCLVDEPMVPVLDFFSGMLAN
ncbi:MAG: tRNA (adenosine(37)-N6)-dimethylallyltransferase MiaA [Proteobacteria bacterium]|nr:tRNA (adenosine(37)-N6)-dimethylallyltransferase MiaA [Burkholderiales bacterium]